MISYLVLVYPQLSADDLSRIQDCRKKNDVLYYGVVDPHFTIVFPIENIRADALIREIKEKSKEIKQIDFIIRCAIVSKNDFNDFYHVFLVPDEGDSDIIKLHDKLYSGLLADELRLDIDFIPHITIASSKDKVACKKIADEWNIPDFKISGRITTLSIVEYTGEKVNTIENIELE